MGHGDICNCPAKYSAQVMRKSIFIYMCHFYIFHGAEENLYLGGCKVARGWKILRNEKLHNIYASSNIIWCDQVNKIVRSCRMHGRDETYKVLVGKREEKRPLGRLGHRWEDNIRKGILEKVGRCGLDASGLG
jgi:hypothetical protein